MMFDKIIIFGLGLIGGSIAKSIKKNNLSNQVLAFNRSDDTIEFSIKNHIIDGKYNFKNKLSSNDLVIISAPLKAYQNIAQSLVEILDDQTLIIDAGSVKSFIGEDIFPILGDFSNNFVTCHPIAGLDKTGVENSVDNLFVDKKLIITSDDNSNIGQIEKIKDFWQKIGSNVEILSNSDHDKIFALTSHIPQFLAFYFKDSSLTIDEGNEFLVKHQRIEKSDKKLWDDIFNFNKVFIDYHISFFKEKLDRMHDFIENIDESPNLNIFHEFNFDLSNENGFNLEFDGDISDNLLARILIVFSYASIADLRSFSSYYGTGFKDFTIILVYLKYLVQKPELFLKLIRNNKSFLLHNITLCKKI